MKTQFASLKMLLFALIGFQSMIAQATNYPSSNFESAKESASKENKLLMLKFTASWCLPCKFMDKTVFSDADLNNYMNDRVIAVQVDIDQFTGMDLKELYQVKSVPTIIFIHPNGKEISRKINSMGIGDFRTWLESLVLENKITATTSTLIPDVTNRIIVEQKEDDFFEDFDKRRLTNLKPEPDVLEPSANNLENNNARIEATNVSVETSSDNSYQESNRFLFGQFYVQMGAFKELENAVNKANKLDEEFSQNASVLEADDHNGNKLYKINLGPFDSEEEAELFVEVLKDRNLEALVKKAEL